MWWRPALFWEGWAARAVLPFNASGLQVFTFELWCNLLMLDFAEVIREEPAVLWQQTFEKAMSEFSWEKLQFYYWIVDTF